MQHFFAEHSEVVSAVMGLMILLIGWLIRDKFGKDAKEIKKVEVQVAKLDKELRAIETRLNGRMDEIDDKILKVTNNYLSRFDKMMEKLTKVHDETITISGKLNGQVQVCQYIQEAKKIK